MYIQIIGSASAADLCFCIFLYYRYGGWADLHGGIGFAVPFGCGMHVSKINSPDFEILVFLVSC